MIEVLCVSFYFKDKMLWYFYHQSTHFTQVTIPCRAIVANSFADAPTQYNYIISTVNAVSEDQAQLRHAVKALQNKDKLRDCKAHEEKEGRENCDLLNHFIVIGGPYFDPGPELQSALQGQISQTNNLNERQKLVRAEFSTLR